MQLKANRLGEMLLEAGLIDQFQLDSALSMQRNLGGRIGSALVKLGYLPEETILEFLESQAKFSRINLADLEIEPEVMTLLPLSRMQHLLVIPIELRKTEREKVLRVAMTDPTNLKLIDDLQFATGCRVVPVLAAENEIRRALQKNLPKSTVKKNEAVVEDAFVERDIVDLTDLQAADPRVERLLDVLQEKGVLSAIDVERVKFG